MSFKLNSIESAIEDIKAGKIIIVVDDEDRENEGDFIAAAEMVNPEMINFMATHGRGLICAPLTEDRCDALNLNMMVEDNTVLHNTQFTVSVDLIGHGCTTGISAYDRSQTIKFLTLSDTKPADLGRPGHIFPLKAKKGGVLRRAGHTEASIDLAKLAGLKPAGILVEILNEDGSMARLPQLIKVAEKFNLKIISIADLIAYRMKHESLIQKTIEVDFPTIWGDFKLAAYKQTTTNEEHIVLYKGSWEPDEAVLVRVESSAFSHNLLDAMRSDKQSNISAALQMINQQDKGVLLFMQQGEKVETIVETIQSYSDQSLLRKMDSKDYGIGAQILRGLGIKKLKLISNSKNMNTTVIHAYGLDVVEQVPFVRSNKKLTL
ncbi:3,4-dihydroxy-2-butanone-4-phosphate synthase [Putridiphycobacter roseus]|uniref:3,4-dihydroxy-2-butanone 4-phosphate synthase n=1 Tax=Putridiphycobacter roseus TaxID=2219161 RepID=A0A2W1N2S6_9FLAO|nr:3,4-dihydroxy-2-butanone-4-phosphate synthase [Putridiphycobacter roseus]PZE17291.1 3,4-dihydroxy-2-butanone-4-phosphate synthase [Putridiphycobacter roseus]